MNSLEFKSANEAFESLFQLIISTGEVIETKSWKTKALYNVGFYLTCPDNNLITNPSRKWSHQYAETEWKWYLSGDRNVQEIGKKAKIWLEICDQNFEVNSNYGYQWKRANQLDYVINLLVEDPKTRRASVSIYDAKEHETFQKDTPCTYAINFRISSDKKLHMSVMMRSCDLVFGFCNDQYCFSKLQLLVLQQLQELTNIDYELGSYYHFVNDLHVYEKHWNIKVNYQLKV